MKLTYCFCSSLFYIRLLQNSIETKNEIISAERETVPATLDLDIAEGYGYQRFIWAVWVRPF